MPIKKRNYEIKRLERLGKNFSMVSYNQNNNQNNNRSSIKGRDKGRTVRVLGLGRVNVGGRAKLRRSVKRQNGVNANQKKRTHKTR
jgi:hypothetical protein